MMMIVRHTQHQIMPWKNGLGQTREIFRHPAQGVEGDFSWRLSIAEVTESGPFSPFPNIARTIVQTSGPPMTLHHQEPGLKYQLGIYQPYEFSGDWQTHCELSGQAQDFNLMIQRATIKSQVKYVSRNTLDQDQILKLSCDAHWLIIFVITGKWVIDGLRLPQPETLAGLDTSIYQKDLAPPAHEEDSLNVLCVNPGHLLVLKLWQIGGNQP